ncbi:InlB B-repeat-containing protein [Olsenella intestinalis]|uniref:InlB B-repeat-containing protein n=1 Tax=Olsenella intestinalis TaxID=2930083 RepID=UPI00200BACAF|nr:InlB B-repeat-containing protein [Olsenella intestinalis]
MGFLRSALQALLALWSKAVRRLASLARDVRVSAARLVAGALRGFNPRARACLSWVLAVAMVCSMLHTSEIARALDLEPAPAAQSQEEPGQEAAAEPAAESEPASDAAAAPAEVPGEQAAPAAQPLEGQAPTQPEAAEEPAPAPAQDPVAAPVDAAAQAQDAAAKAAEEERARKEAEERVRAELQARRDSFEVAPEGVDESLAAGKDFSSQRLLISGVTREQLTPATRVLSEHKGLFLTQFDSADKAKNAYLFYKGALGAALVEPDVTISAADGAPGESAAAPMSEDENPLADLHREMSSGMGASGYTVALLDTGYLGEGVADSASMLGDSAADDNGHGSSMAAYLREADADARIVSVKVLDASGVGTVSSVYAGIEYAIAAHVDVINLSLSAWRTAENEVVATAIADAAARGIIVVGAAGNNGVDASLTVPGGVGEALVAGACDESGARIAGSNYGSTVDVFAKAGSTSEAAARVSGWLSANEVGSDWQGRVASAVAEGAFSEGSAFAAKPAGPAAGQGGPTDGRAGEGGVEGSQGLAQRGGGAAALRRDLEYGFKAAADNPHILVTGTCDIRYKGSTDTIPINTVIPFASNYASGLKRSVAGRDYYIYLTRSSEGAHQFCIKMSGTGDTLSYNVTIDYVDIDGSGFAFTKSGYDGVTSDAFRIASLGTVGKSGTVAFDGNGGSGSGPGMTAYTAGYSNPYTMPANTYTAPAHKHFKEWNSSSDGTGKGYQPGDKPSFTYYAPKFYAIWENDAFGVSLDKKGGTGGTDTVYAKNAGTDAGVYLDLDLTQKMTASANPITVPTRNYTVTYNQNYEGAPASPTATSAATFEGYFSQESEGTQYIGQSGYIDEATFTPTTFAEASTIFAQWGDGAAVTLASPTREGYAFAGWYKDAACGDADKVGDAGASYTPTTDTELFAKWTPNTYNVSYARNDSAEQPAVGDLPTAPATATFDQDFVAPACALKRVTFGFAGWNTSADGSGHAFAPGTPATWADAADTTLYAQWRPASYILAFEGLEGATHGDLPTSAEYGTTFSVANPTHEGCDFAGWQISGMDEGVTHYYGDGEPTQTTTAASLGPTFATAFKSLSGTDAATVTFTATWTPRAYHAHLDPGLVADVSQGTPDVFWDYGVASYFSDSTHGATLASVRAPQATGYTFRGYFTESAGAGTRYVNGDGSFVAASDVDVPLYKTVGEDVTLYAYWTPNVSQVTLDGCGGTGGPDALWAKYGFGVYSDSACVSEVSLSGITPPTYDRREFGGYYTQRDGGGTQMIDASGHLTTAFTSTAVPFDLTLFAKWTPDVYELSLDGNGATGPSDQQQADGYTTRVFEQYGVGYFAEGDAAEKTVSSRLARVVVPERTYAVTFADGSSEQTRTSAYEFGGYFSGRDGSGTQLVDATGTFVSADGTAASASGSYYASWRGGSVSAPIPASRDAETFVGWRSGSTLYQPGDTITPTSDLRLEAQWESAVFQVALDGGDGAQPNTGTERLFARYGDDVYTGRTDGATPTYTGAMIADGARLVAPDAKSRTVTFALQDPSDTTSPTMSEPTQVSVPLDFEGYFTSPTGGIKAIDASGAVTSEISATTFKSDTTLHARWTPGSIELPTPTCAGYTFAGWSESPGVDGTGFKGTYTASDDVTLYAKWAPNGSRSFQVRFEGVEGLSVSYLSTLPSTVYVDGSESSLEVANPSRVGGRFDGWVITGMTAGLTHELWSKRVLSNGQVQYDVERCEGTTFGNDDEGEAGLTIATKAVEFRNLHDGSGSGDANTVTFTALWSETDVPLTLDGQGATTEATPAVLYEAYDDGSSYVEPPDVDPMPDEDPEGEVVPPDEGNFGIFLDSAFGKRMTTDKNPIGIPERVARVTYRANDGTGDAGQGAVLEVANRTFQFTGFYSLTGGSGHQVIDPQGYVTAGFVDGKAFSEATTLYAGWSGEEFVVREAPEKEGLTFIGWNTKPDGTGDSYQPGDALDAASDLSLFAQWTPAVFAIALDAGEATTPGTPVIYQKYATGLFSAASCEDAERLGSLPQVPVRTYEVTLDANDGSGATRSLTPTWEFAGYFTEPGGVGEKVIGDRGAFSSALAAANFFTANATLHAQWVGADVTLPGPEAFARTGYTLVGWSEVADGSGDLLAPGSTVDKGVRLFAQWEPNVYEVALEAAGAEGARTEGLFARYGDGVYTTRGGTASEPTFEGNLIAGATLAIPQKPAMSASYDAAGGSVSPTDEQRSARPAFLGYFTAEAGGEKMVGADGSAAPSLSATTFLAPASLYAQWGAATVELPTPSWDNHTFLGWTATDGAGQVLASGLTGTYALPGDVTLTAAWVEGDKPTYAIAYPAFDGVSGVPAAFAAPTVAARDESVTIPNPVMDHFVFEGWQVNGAGELTRDTTFTNLAAAGDTATLVAHWSAETYPVTLSTTDASGAQTATTPGTTQVFERYSAGMYLDASCAPESKMTSTANKVQPPERVFTVSYDVNAGAGSGIVAPDAQPATSAFEGFYSARDGGSQVIAPDGSVSASAQGGTLFTNASEAYVRWTPASVTIAAQPVDDSGQPREGYVFLGWNTAADGSGTSFSAGDALVPSANVTLYAQWSVITYPVSYNANGGVGGPAQQDKMHGVDLTLSGETPTHDDELIAGYRVRLDPREGTLDGPDTLVANRIRSVSFDSWNTEADGSGLTEFTPSGTYSDDAPLTLFAKWTYGAETLGSVTLPAPTRAGYEFAGWSDENPYAGDLAYLSEVIDEAQAALDAHDSAEDRAATEHERPALEDALATARDVVSRQSTSQSEIDEATQGLLVALWSFNDRFAPEDDLDGQSDAPAGSVRQHLSVQATWPAGGEYVPTGDVTLFATWVPSPYAFTLGSASGVDTTGSSATGSYRHGGGMRVVAKVAEGWVWQGWKSSDTTLLADSLDQEYDFPMPMGDVTLTPVVTPAADEDITFDMRAFDFQLSLSEASGVSEERVLHLAGACATNVRGEEVPFTCDTSAIEARKGDYPVTFTTSRGTTTTVTCSVMDAVSLDDETDNVICADDVLCLTTSEVVEYEREGLDQRLIERVHARARNVWSGEALPVSVTDRGGLCAEKGVYPVTFHANPSATIDCVVCDAGAVSEETGTAIYGNHFDISSADVAPLLTGDGRAFAKLLALAGVRAVDANGNSVAPMGVNVGALAPMRGTYDIVFYTEDGTFVVVQANVDGGGRRYRAAISLATRGGRGEEGLGDGSVLVYADGSRRMARGTLAKTGDATQSVQVVLLGLATLSIWAGCRRRRGDARQGR